MPLSPQDKKAIASKIPIAVVHRYVWNHQHCFEGAPSKSYVRERNLAKALHGYRAAVFGDNHKGFIDNAGECTVINNGAFQCRNSDERTYNPFVTLIQKNTVTVVPLDCRDDKFIPKEEAALIEEKTFGVQQFLTELGKLASQDLNFKDAIDTYFSKYEVTEGAQRMIRKALDNHED